MQDKRIEQIKLINWYPHVERRGFLQSKDICNEAEIQPIKISRSVTLKYNNIFWMQDLNVYSDEEMESFIPKFKKAFKEDDNWPVKIINKFFEEDGIKKVGVYIVLDKKEQLNQPGFTKTLTDMIEMSDKVGQFLYKAF